MEIVTAYLDKIVRKVLAKDWKIKFSTHPDRTDRYKYLIGLDRARIGYGLSYEVEGVQLDVRCGTTRAIFNLSDPKSEAQIAEFFRWLVAESHYNMKTPSTVIEPTHEAEDDL